MSKCVCLYVCLWGYLQNHTCNLHQIFNACCLWPRPVFPVAGDEIPTGRGNFGCFLPHLHSAWSESVRRWGRVGGRGVQFRRPRTPTARRSAVCRRTFTFTLLASQLDVTELEVVYRGRPDHHERYSGHIGQNTPKTSVRGPLEAKPEVEIWRRPDILTQRPRLPIRLPIPPNDDGAT